MAVFPTARFGILATVLLVLTACDDAELAAIFSGDSAKSKTEATADTTPRTGGSVQVVEAPEIFDVAETALWDGRPSLGLIWVAYEGADPTNVIIRNEENGKFVVGALYRRERFFPGPPFQLSSDAAAELGILAGNPTAIRVIALKEETVAPEPAPEPETPVEEPADIDPEAPADIVPLPAASEIPAVVDPIEAAAAAIEAADPAAAIVPALAPAVPARRPTVEGPNAPLPRRIPAPEPEPSILDPIEATPLSGPVIEPIAAPGPGVTTLARPFIQVGIFAVLENAQNAAQGLSDAGVIPFIEEQRVGGRTFYRVVVGPAGNATERDNLLQKIQSQGFEDAYFVTN